MRAFKAIAFALATAAPVSPAGAAMLTAAVCATVIAEPAVRDAVYVEGVDARGRRVVPADVEAPYTPGSFPTAFDVTVPAFNPKDELNRRFRPEGDIAVARVLLDRHGRPRFRGQASVETGQRSARVVCAELIDR